MDVLNYFMCELFVLTFCSTCNIATASVFSSNYFHGVADVTILDGQHRSEGKAVSRLACVNKCLDCPFLTFDVNTNECKSYLHANSTMIPSTGVEIWFNEPTKGELDNDLGPVFSNTLRHLLRKKCLISPSQH